MTDFFLKREVIGNGGFQYIKNWRKWFRRSRRRFRRRRLHGRNCGEEKGKIQQRRERIYHLHFDLEGHFDEFRLELSNGTWDMISVEYRYYFLFHFCTFNAEGSHVLLTCYFIMKMLFVSFYSIKRN